jgi:hypothetical protein
MKNVAANSWETTQTKNARAQNAEENIWIPERE